MLFAFWMGGVRKLHINGRSLRHRRLRWVLAIALSLALPEEASAWWNKSWSHRRKLTFDNSASTASLPFFTALIVLDGSRIDYAKTQNAGEDLRFVDADDATLLDHEIELWNEAGTSYVWVEIPLLDGPSSTDFIWMYYGNPAAPALPAAVAESTWNGYQMVQHLEETSGPHLDSTSFNTDSTFVSVASQGTATGRIDGTDDFDRASSQKVEVVDNGSLDMPDGTSFTVEAWVQTTFTAGYQMAFSKESRCVVCPDGDGEIQLWTDTGGTASFWLNDGTGAFARADSVTFVADGSWHYLVGRWDDPTDTAEIWVDGTVVATFTNALGTIATSTPGVIGDEGDGPPGSANWDGLLDEVRVSKILRPPDYIRAQYKSMREDNFVAFGAEAAHCCDLSSAETATTVTVTAANRFELRFNAVRGGGIDLFYDLEEDPGRAVDLAGAAAIQYVLFSDEIVTGGNSYYVGSNLQGSKLSVLEATPTRVRLRQEGFYQQDLGGAILPGARGTGTYSIYGSGRTAIDWNRKTTAVVPYSQLQLNNTVRQTVGAPLDTWTTFSESGATPPNRPGTDNYALLQNEAAGARTDFLSIIYQDWTAADQTFGNSDPPNQFLEVSWRENTVGSLPSGSSEDFRLLTYFKPTNFTNNLDPAVVSRSADFRGPDPLTILVGQSWLSASENTSVGDDFNEAEAAYALTLDPASGQGLRFRIDGTVGTPRYTPFFKIRQWRALSAPTSGVTLDGAALAPGVSYRADVKPVSRAHYANILSWHSTLESAAAVTTPDAGTSGTVVGTTSFFPGRFGNAGDFTVNGDYVSFGDAGNFNPSIGAVEFWYQPSYECQIGPGVCDGTRHVLWSMEGDATHFMVLEKSVANNLDFIVQNGGAVSRVRIALPNFAWRAFDWVHIRATWDDSAALAGERLRLFVNESEPAHTDTGAYSAIGMITGPNRIGCNAMGPARTASGLIDEFHMYVGGPTPSRFAYGGLTSNANEYLADPSPARNFLLMNLAVDGSRRGQYAYFGADSQFRGLNVALSQLGTGVGDDDLVWEYWNGTAWANLESVGGFTDETRSFKSTGSVFWQDPPAWSPYSVNGGPDLYYVRIHLDAASPGYTQIPVEALIKTDILLLQYCEDITTANREFFIPAPIPTAVSLESFSATARDSAVDLSWTTGSELRNLGFHLYRSTEADGPWERITVSVIPGLGSSPAGASYSYRDSGLRNGTQYFYLLEDIENTGGTKRHGPVSATPEAGAGAAPPGSDGDSPSVVTYGEPEATSLRVVSRRPGQVVLELTTDGFLAFPREDGTVRLEIPGFAEEDALGLPVKRHWLEAVAGRKVEILSVRPKRVETIELRPAGSEAGELVASIDGTQSLRRARRPKNSREARGLVPESAARIATVGFQGDDKKALLELAPLRWNAASGQLSLARTLVVTVGFRGREPGELVSRDGRRGRRERRAGSATRGVVARLATRERGLYAARFGDIFGRKTAAIPVKELRLSRLGQETAFRIEPSRARFAPGSTLFFLSDGAGANPYGTEAVYELQLGASGSLMPEVSAPPDDRTVSFYERRALFEEDRYYQAALLEAEDNWLWEMLLAPSTKGFSFSASLLASPSEAARLEIFLQGASDFPESPDHHVRISVNGTLVGEDAWDAKEARKVEVELPPGVLQEGDNRLEIENVGDTGAEYSMFFLDRFVLNYRKVAAAEEGVLEGTWEESGAAEVTSLRSAPYVLDVTDETPRWLTGARRHANAVRFPVEAGRSYTVVDSESVMRPRVRKASPPRWSQKGRRAGYVAIGPRDLLDAAKPLLDFRRLQGLEVAAVPIDEIFDEMGYGESRPEAVRDFLSYAYHHWQGGVRYALLLGDASYDFKNLLGTGVENQVPALPLRTSYLWTASDPALASVNGEDLLPDIAIGRLPAKDAGELGTMVRKILAYENGPVGLGGPVVLITDDPDAAGDFDADAKDLASSVLASRSVRHISLAALGVSETRRAILEAFDQGASSVSYMGHGGIHLWASENVFDNDAVGRLAPQNRNPVVLALDCLNGYFHFPFFDSLGEKLLKAERKGALAVIAPSGLSLNEPAHRFHRALLEELSSTRNRTLGDAVLEAQARYLETGTFPSLLAIYHLFSDPALTLK